MLLQAEGPNSIVACWPAVFRELYYTLPKHNIVISFGPTDFVQVNAKTNHALIDLALELLEPAKQERLLDLFCGLGNFTLPIARYCNEVIGVEGDPELVQRAQHNAEQNHLTNVKFIHADLYTESGDLALPEALCFKKRTKYCLIRHARARSRSSKRYRSLHHNVLFTSHAIRRPWPATVSYWFISTAIV